MALENLKRVIHIEEVKRSEGRESHSLYEGDKSVQPYQGGGRKSVWGWGRGSGNRQGVVLYVRYVDSCPHLKATHGYQ